MNGGIMSASNREKLLDYVFTQQYIWETLGQSDAKFVDSSIQSQYESFKTKIDNQIANIQKRPSFTPSIINIDAGTSKTLTDTNSVLKDYVSFDRNIDGLRIKHNKGENTMTISVDKNYTNETLKLTEDKMKSWGIIKEETADNDTTIFFTFKEGVQNQLYSLNYNDPVTMPLNIKINIFGNLKINKTDVETNKPIDNTVFELLDTNNNVVRTGTTNNKGELEFNNLKPAAYKIKEKKSNDNYINNNDIYDIVINPSETTTKNITNKHKKGNLKIYKVDKDDNDLTLGAVEFDLIDSNGSIVKHLVTDVNGIVEVKNINTGNYTLRETLTKKEYNLAIDQNVIINWNETMEYKVENEKKKGQIKIIKVDADYNEVKLEGVEFQIIDKNNNIIETIKTNSEGEAVTSRIPIGEYTLKETKTDNMHILNEEIVKVDVSTDIISKLEITNERIKGQIKVIKTSEDDNFINGKEKGSPIENVKFEVYDSNNNLVDEITTSEDGTAITRLLDKGCYFIKEVESGEWYLLNDNTFEAEIKEHQEIVSVGITNESEKPDVDIEKTGIIQTTANQEIRYDFHIKNTGNVKLNHFTWYDYLPTDYVKITKLITGTYNQDLNYSIYYKTNKNDYKLLKDNLNTQVNNNIDFSKLELEADEYITEFKADFGTVDVGFESVINPYIFVRVNSNVHDNDTFTNKTRIEGYNKTYMVWDEDDHITKVYEKEVPVKKLPRTGM
jgi:uncharacterized surface anchored protein